MQTWLSLVASQPTTLRDCYVNQKFDLKLPCIITTNSVDMVMQFVTNPLFNTQVIVVEIDKYMGPPGTYREELYKQNIFLGEKTRRELLKSELRKEEIANYRNDIGKILFNVYKKAQDDDDV